MATGLYGGTFNPFHNGHLGITQHVKTEFDLEKIVFIPSAIPPHKPGTGLAPAKFRYQMVNESLQESDGLEVSDIELARQGPSFTIDTVNEFKKKHNVDHVFYLLMGSDAFLDITTWERKDDIFKTIEIIIMLRGEWDSLTPITQFIHGHIDNSYTLDDSKEIFSHHRLKKIHICQVPRIDISSSLIREKISGGQPIQNLVPPCVDALIKTKELYR